MSRRDPYSRYLDKGVDRKGCVVYSNFLRVQKSVRGIAGSNLDTGHVEIYVLNLHCSSRAAEKIPGGVKIRMCLLSSRELQ